MERSQEGMANILWWRWFGRRWVSDVHVQAGQVTNRCTRPTARFTLGPRDKSFLTKSCCDSGSRPTSPDRVASLPRLIAPLKEQKKGKGETKMPAKIPEATSTASRDFLVSWKNQSVQTRQLEFSSSIFEQENWNNCVITEKRVASSFSFYRSRSEE